MSENQFFDPTDDDDLDAVWDEGEIELSCTMFSGHDDEWCESCAQDRVNRLFGHERESNLYWRDRE